MRDASLCDSAAESESAPAEAAGDNASTGAMAPLPGCAPMSSQLRTARNAPANSQASATNRTPASSQLRIRPASADDADGIRAVYAPFVSTPVTFEEEVPSREAYRKRIESICEKYPCLVAEEGGRIVGFAYAHELRERIAFQWNAELSVYLAKRAAGRGLGTTLYGALLALLQKQGVRNVYGIVTLPNPASEALHRHFGFRTVGAYTRSGYKNGRWLDVGIFEKQIGSFDGEPEPLQPIGAIADREEILRVYNQH